MATEPVTEPATEPATEPTTDTPVSRPSRRSFGNLGWYLLLIALATVVLFPVWMTIARALSNGSATLFAPRPSAMPYKPIEWGAFGKAFTDGQLGRPLLVSALVTVIVVTAQTATSVAGAYAFAFLEFPFKRLLFALTAATLLLPIEVTLIANIQTLQNAGLINPGQSFVQAIGSLTLPFLASAFGIFLIRQGFLGIPKDLRDAAKLDGYGDLGFLWRVAIPTTRPVIGSFVLISFLGAYNQYVWPRFSVKANRWDTIQIALRRFGLDNPDQLNLGFAAAIIAAIPVLILLLVFQKQLIRGLTAGAVK